MSQFVLDASFLPTGDQPQAIEQLVAGIEKGFQDQCLLGVTGSGKTFVIANVIAKSQRPALIMAPNKTLAAQLYSELKAFFPQNAVEYFVSYYDYYQPEAYVPSTDTFIEKDASINAHVEQMRLSATKAILDRPDCIIVATVSAIYGLGDPKQYLEMVLHISVGEKIERKTILKRLAQMQYTRNMDQFHRASYQVKGDIIDVFPADSEKEAVRIMLFDDTIEAIHLFDPLTKSIHHSISRVTIFPKNHYVTPKETLLKAIEEIKKELKIRLKELEGNNKLLEHQRLKQRTEFDLEMIQELGFCTGIENYSRYLSGRSSGEPPPCLLDYLPKNALLFIDESHIGVPQIAGMYHGDRSRKTNLVEYGFRLPSALDNRPLTFEEFEKLKPASIYVSATPAEYEKERAQNLVELMVRPTGLLDPECVVRPVAGQVDDLLGEIKQRVIKKERVLITTLTKRMSEDLCEYYSDQGIKVRYLHSDINTVERVEILRDLRLGTFDVLIGINLLREGIDLPEVSLVAILDADREGFLRSYRSLIQTIGRAARHVNGQAILYADHITRSMHQAIDETRRRRQIQSDFNKQHGITPKGISRDIHGFFDTKKPASSMISIEINKKEEEFDLETMSAQAFNRLIKQMENNMYEYADNMDFEMAAKVRDTITDLKAQFLTRK